MANIQKRDTTQQDFDSLLGGIEKILIVGNSGNMVEMVFERLISAEICISPKKVFTLTIEAYVDDETTPTGVRIYTRC